MNRVLLPLLALLLTGCLETKETIRLSADGTGKLLQVTRLDPKKQDALLRAFLTLYGKELPADAKLAADPTAEAWTRRLAKRSPGYDVTLLETRSEDGIRRTTTSGTFQDLRAAVKAGAFPGAAVRLERKGSRAWRLGFRHGWGLVGDVSRKEVGGRQVGTLVEKLSKGFQGWRIDRVVVFPSKVLETNGAVDADGVTVTWRLTIQDLVGASEIEHWARFEDREGLELRPFRVNPDPRALVRRLLGKPPKPPKAQSGS